MGLGVAGAAGPAQTLRRTRDEKASVDHQQQKPLMVVDGVRRKTWQPASWAGVGLDANLNVKPHRAKCRCCPSLQQLKRDKGWDLPRALVRPCRRPRPTLVPSRQLSRASNSSWWAAVPSRMTPLPPGQFLPQDLSLCVCRNPRPIAASSSSASSVCLYALRYLQSAAIIHPISAHSSGQSLAVLTNSRTPPWVRPPVHVSGGDAATTLGHVFDARAPR